MFEKPHRFYFWNNFMNNKTILTVTGMQNREEIWQQREI